MSLQPDQGPPSVHDLESGPDADRESAPDADPESGPDADPESVVRAIVLRQLTMAPRSRAQLASKLAQRGAPADVAGRVLDRFEQVGLVDDAAFAQGWVRSRQATKGLSRRALGRELRSKGIDDELARSALDTIGVDDERQAAEQLVARRLRAVRGLPRDKQVARLAGMLARKGYSSGLAMQVVREALDADAQSSAEEA